MNAKNKSARGPAAGRPAIESLEQRAFLSTTHPAVSIEAPLQTPVAAASTTPVISPNIARSSAQLNVPIAKSASADADDAAALASSSAQTTNGIQMRGLPDYAPDLTASGRLSPAGAAPRDAIPAGVMAFVSQVFSLLGRISISANSAATASSDATAAPIATAETSIGVMAVEASATAPTAMSLTSTNEPASAGSQAVPVTPVTTASITNSTASNATDSVPIIGVPQTLPIAPKPDASTIGSQLNAIATAFVHAATGSFEPIAQAITSSAEPLAVQDVAPIAYNFVRFDATAFLTGAVAEFTDQLESMAPLPGVHAFTADPRWVWLITGAVVTADVVLIAHWQIRRAQADRARSAACASLFGERFVSDFFRD